MHAYLKIFKTRSCLYFTAFCTWWCGCVCLSWFLFWKSDSLPRLRSLHGNERFVCPSSESASRQRYPCYSVSTQHYCQLAQTVRWGWCCFHIIIVHIQSSIQTYLYTGWTSFFNISLSYKTHDMNVLECKNVTFDLYFFQDSWGRVFIGESVQLRFMDDCQRWSIHFSFFFNKHFDFSI